MSHRNESRQSFSSLTLRIVPTFDVSSFITTYFPIPFFAVLFFGYKFYAKSKIVKYEEMDFQTGSSADMVNETDPKSEWKKLTENI